MQGIEFRRPVTTALLAIALLATAGASPSHAQDGTQNDESSQNDDGTNYGWLGLIGLAGLMPKKRRDEHHTTTHTR